MESTVHTLANHDFRCGQFVGARGAMPSAPDLTITML